MPATIAETHGPSFELSLGCVRSTVRGEGLPARVALPRRVAQAPGRKLGRPIEVVHRLLPSLHRLKDAPAVVERRRIFTAAERFAEIPQGGFSIASPKRSRSSSVQMPWRRSRWIELERVDTSTSTISTYEVQVGAPQATTVEVSVFT